MTTETLSAPSEPRFTRLNSEQINRYKRHLILPEVGMEGQMKLLNAQACCASARAGWVARSAFIWRRRASERSGWRTWMSSVPAIFSGRFSSAFPAIGEDKVKAAGQAAQGSESRTSKSSSTRWSSTASNVLDLIKDYDVIIDGTDNFPTRYCVNDACVMLKKPNVYGSIFRFEGMVTVFAPHLENPDRPGEKGPCYRCMYPEPPDPGSVPSCAEGGVIGVLPGIIGTLQANEVIKLILGVGQAGDRAAHDFQRAGPGIQDLQTAARSELPGVRRASDDHRADRLRSNSAACRFSIRRAWRKRRRKCRRPRRAIAAGAAGLILRWMRGDFRRDTVSSPIGKITPREVKATAGCERRICFHRLPAAQRISRSRKSTGRSLFRCSRLPQRLGELKGHRERKDRRPLQERRDGRCSSRRLLRQQGFKDVKSMAGGILLWNKDINPGGPQY